MRREIVIKNAEDEYKLHLYLDLILLRQATLAKDLRPLKATTYRSDSQFTRKQEIRKIPRNISVKYYHPPEHRRCHTRQRYSENQTLRDLGRKIYTAMHVAPGIRLPNHYEKSS